MVRMTHGGLCPRCREGKVRRIHRQAWMRRLPASKHYCCEACRAKFLAVFGWPIKLPQKPPVAESP